MFEAPDLVLHNLTVAPNGDMYYGADRQDQQDIWLAKRRHEDGALAWTIHATALPGAGNVWMPHLGTDFANNLLVTGYASGDVDFGGTLFSSTGGAFAAKFDPDGQLLWARTIQSSTSICGLGITASPSGRVYAVGDCSGTLAFGSTSVECEGDYLAAFEADGTPRWAASYAWGGLDNDPRGTAATDEHVVLTGVASSGAKFGAKVFDRWRGTFAFSFGVDGEPDWAVPIASGGAATTLDPRGNLVLADAETISSIDPTGSRQWQVALTGAHAPWSLAVIASGTIVAASSPTLDLYAFDGAFVDERWLDVPDVRWLAPTATGSVVFVGSYYSAGVTHLDVIGMTEPID